jgi:hypothetical protein
MLGSILRIEISSTPWFDTHFGGRVSLPYAKLPHDGHVLLLYAHAVVWVVSQGILTHPAGRIGWVSSF